MHGVQPSEINITDEISPIWGAPAFIPNGYRQAWLCTTDLNSKASAQRSLRRRMTTSRILMRLTFRGHKRPTAAASSNYGSWRPPGVHAGSSKRYRSPGHAVIERIQKDARALTAIDATHAALAIELKVHPMQPYQRIKDDLLRGIARIAIGFHRAKNG